ncbi:hypothetical protein [Streptomyces sp. NPDC059761]|uniref:hypothetical protein n=1 Tax=Streptomyces sp. NPDC059761 TaxID=3346937 RepID=UPI00364BEB8E
MLFVSAPSGETILGRLADQFFRELQAFGVLTSSSVLTEETNRSYVTTRSGFILSFLETLSEVCDLRFAAHSNVPFCYNRAGWRSEAPVGGYTDAESEVLPHEVAMSLMLNCQQRADGAPARRLLTCALWRLADKGLGDAVTYLFDLHQAGFAGSDDVGVVTFLLLRAHSHAGSCDALLERSIGRPATGGTDWLAVDPDFEWVGPAPLDGESKKVLTALFLRAGRKVEETRAADNFDDWILGQIHLAGLLTTVLSLVNDLVENVPLPWRVRLSQWEEIIADAKSLLLTSRAGFDMLSQKSRIGYVAVVGSEIRRNVGENWQQRLYEERLLVPTRMRGFFFPDDADAAADDTSSSAASFPPEWASLSWRVIHPWLITINGDVPTLVPPEGEDGADGEALVAEVAAIHRLGEERRYAEAELRVRSLVARHPYMEFLYVERAIALDLQNQPAAALEDLLTAVFLDPRNPLTWESLSIVLARLGSHEEAVFARAFAEFMESLG